MPDILLIGVRVMKPYLAVVKGTSRRTYSYILHTAHVLLKFDIRSVYAHAASACGRNACTCSFAHACPTKVTNSLLHSLLVRGQICTYFPIIGARNNCVNTRPTYPGLRPGKAWALWSTVQVNVILCEITCPRLHPPTFRAFEGGAWERAYSVPVLDRCSIIGFRKRSVGGFEPQHQRPARIIFFRVKLQV